MAQASKRHAFWQWKTAHRGKAWLCTQSLRKCIQTKQSASGTTVNHKKKLYSMITSQTKQSAEMNNLANYLTRWRQHDGKITNLTGIGEFRLSDKTSTQANNATGGLAKGGNRKWDKQRCWETQRVPTKPRIFENIVTMPKRYLFQKSLKKCAAKPNFDHCTVFDENPVAVHMQKTE